MTSKLAQMQAKFQQKQMQEKEEKLLKIYENQQQRAFERVGRGSAGSNSSGIGSTGGGKVRQMFEERRQKAGIDKSYPLEPLKSKTTKKSTITSRTAVKSTVKKTVTQTKSNRPLVTQSQTGSYQKVYNNNEEDLVDSMNNHKIYDDLDSETMPKIGFDDNFQIEQPLYMTGKLSNVGGKLPSQKVEQKRVSNGVSQRARPEPKTVAKKVTPAKSTAPVRSNSSISSASSQGSRRSPEMSTPPPRAPVNNRPSSKQTANTPVVRDDLAECKFCGRRFATDRLGKHEDICGKTAKKKRKTFDATKHRVQGTELEGYVLKSKKSGVSSKPSKVSAPKANWRKTHEEFIAAIRAAKEAQAYVAKGGKLADLPPPPPSSNPDYVQCPHCGRKFNQAAAERHIPKCADFQFNKPKPAAKGKR